MLEDYKKNPRHSKQKQEENYQGNVMKIQVNVMNIKDHEEQEGMEISEERE